MPSSRRFFEAHSNLEVTYSYVLTKLMKSQADVHQLKVVAAYDVRRFQQNVSQSSGIGVRTRPRQTTPKCCGNRFFIRPHIFGSLIDALCSS